LRRWQVAILILALVLIVIVVLWLISNKRSPQVGTFYYVWYGAPDSGNWGSSMVVDYPVYPLLGNYSSSNATVIEQQLVLMKDLGVDFVVISWWGCNENDSYGQFIDSNAKKVFQVAEDNMIDLKFAIMVEPYNKNGGPYNFTEIYNHIWDDFVSPYPSLYFSEGKPLLFFFARADNDSLTNNGTLPPDMNGTRFKTVLVGQTDYVQWVYTDLNCFVKPKRVPYTDEISVTPRFDDSRVPGRTPCVVDPNLTQGTYDIEWENAIQLWRDGKIDTIMITSWNEYPERTAIEPHYDATAYTQDQYYLYNKTKEYISQVHLLSSENCLFTCSS
jgi:hypothetical protein